MPQTRAGQRHGRVAAGAGAVAVLDVVPLEEERQRVADPLDQRGRDQAAPPAVVAGVQPLLLHRATGRCAWWPAGPRSAWRRLTIWPGSILARSACSAGASSWLGCSRLSIWPPTMAGSVSRLANAASRIATSGSHSTSSSMNSTCAGPLAGRGGLVEATGEAAGTTEVGLAHVVQLVPQRHGHLGEPRVRLDRVAALVDDVQRAHEFQRHRVIGQRGQRGDAVVHPVVRADHHGRRHHGVGRRDGPAHPLDPQVRVDGLRFQPHRAAVDEACPPARPAGPSGGRRRRAAR